MSDDSFLTMKEVMHMTTLSRDSIYRLLRKNKFPAPIKLSERRIVWERHVIQVWKEGRITATKQPETKDV